MNFTYVKAFNIQHATVRLRTYVEEQRGESFKIRSPSPTLLSLSFSHAVLEENLLDFFPRFLPPPRDTGWESPKSAI